MDCVLCYHVRYGEYQKGKEAENNHREYSCQREERVGLVLYISHHLNIAIGTLPLDWTINYKVRLLYPLGQKV
jgi:hypothetical protein